MPYTASEAISRFRLAYGQCDPDVALDYLNDVMRDLATYYQFLDGSASVSVTAGTREYALSTSSIMARIRSVQWLRSATDRSALCQTSTDWLDEHIPTWREMTQTTDRDEPTYVYFTVKSDGLRYIGFHPIPDETTSSGYPSANLYGSVFGDVSADDSLPDVFPSLRVLTEGMKMFYAQDADKENFPFWQTVYFGERSAAAVAIKGALEEHKSYISPRHLDNNKVV